MMRSILLTLILAAPTFVAPCSAYEPTPENLEAREWFQDAKFGLFVHWGVYATLADGEWVMNRRRMNVPEYERLAGLFNPVKFDADEWVAMVKDAGMRYITITSKHHDGFAMWATQQNDWNVVDRTPYGRDILKQLAEACRKQDIKLFFYHSQLDWHHLDYYPRGRTGHNAARPDEGSWESYLDFVDAQLEELLTGYGPIGGIWFDGMWDKKDAEWRIEQTYDLIHRLQPAAMVGSNHHVTPFAGEDFQMFEKDLPGQNSAGFNEAGISTLPLESANTMNTSWGYNAGDSRHKTRQELLHFLIRAAGANANLLLNVGPLPDGTIQPVHRERLAEMGEWLRENGESIYGTRGGPIPPRHWGVSTHKGSRVYLHALEPEDGLVAAPDFGKEIVSAKLLDGGASVRFEKQDWGWLVFLPEEIQDPTDTIVVLETR